MIRICVLIDVGTSSPVEAYRTVRRALDAARLDWESSDEWYDADGDAIDPEEVQQIRKRVFAEEPPL
jgi:hypothetical protein